MDLHLNRWAFVLKNRGTGTHVLKDCKRPLPSLTSERNKVKRAQGLSPAIAVSARP